MFLKSFLLSMARVFSDLFDSMFPGVSKASRILLIVFAVGAIYISYKAGSSLIDYVTNNTKEQLANKVVVQKNQIDNLEKALAENARALEDVRKISQTALEAVQKQIVVEKVIHTHTETIVREYASSVESVKNDPTLSHDEKREKISVLNIDMINKSYYDFNASAPAGTGERK